MFENLMVVAAIAAVLWLGAYAYYVFTSRGQQEIGRDIEALEKKLRESREGEQ